MPKNFIHFQYKSPEIGQEISCMMYNIDKSFLTDNKQLENILKTALVENKFEILKISSCEFIPKGYTVAFTLGESHLVTHTYPEHDSIYVNMYSCRSSNDAELIIKYIQDQLHPGKIVVISDNRVPASENAAKNLGML